MELTFAEDFSSSVSLDSELTSTPDSGLYWNRGVLPIVTVDNILSFLPNKDFTFTAWDSETTYSKFETSRKQSDIVTYNSKIYLSKLDSNLDKEPGTETDYWLETNIESLRIRSFIWSVKDNLTSALSLSRKLIENQYIYNIGDTLVTLPNDYAGWAFEPKGSDYVKIRINQIALQANTTDDVSLYVINQGELVTTLTLTPEDGKLVFDDLDYTITGKGRFLFVIDSQAVYSNSAYNDPLKYDGFVCYPVVGIGSTPEGSTYSESANGNGMNFNISAYLDSSKYLTNNLVDFPKALQAQFEFDFIQMMQFNANNRANRDSRMLVDDKNLLTFHTTDLKSHTIARRYEQEIRLAKISINKTFDKFLKSRKKFSIRRSSI